MLVGGWFKERGSDEKIRHGIKEYNLEILRRIQELRCAKSPLTLCSEGQTKSSIEPLTFIPAELLAIPMSIATNAVDSQFMTERVPRCWNIIASQSTGVQRGVKGDGSRVRAHSLWRGDEGKEM